MLKGSECGGFKPVPRACLRKKGSI